MPWQIHLGHIDEPNTLIRASIKRINAVPAVDVLISTAVFSLAEI